MRKPLFFPALAVLVLLLSSPSPAEQAQYVGVRGCRTCHGSPPRDHYHDWLASRHARAYEALRGKAKTDPACLSCHTTGREGPLAPGVTPNDLLGVQCEACHGPGSLYRYPDLMKDRKAAGEKGLQMPTRKTCLKCHR